MSYQLRRGWVKVQIDDRYPDSVHLATIYVESGMERCAFWECVLDIVRSGEYELGTGGTCERIKGRTGERDGFGASRPWRFIRLVKQNPKEGQS